MIKTYKNQLSANSLLARFQFHDDIQSTSANLVQLIDQLVYSLQNNETSNVVDIIEIINTLYSINENFSISSYVTISLLISMLPQSLNNQYLLPLLEFYNNLTNDLTDQILEFFTSFEFLPFIQNVLTDSSKSEILEYSTLILINTMLNNDNVYLHYLDFGMHQIISQIHNDDIIITENKAYIFCIFLKYNLNEYEQVQSFILNENFKNLKSKTDSFKCIAIKGLIYASQWSECLYDFFLSNS